MVLRVAFGSDMHFESHKYDPKWMPPLPNSESVDVMILAGDIGVKQITYDAIKRITDALPDTEVIFVAGNHEFYRSSIDDLTEEFRLNFAKGERIHFLENDSVVIKGVKFLGCTLWTGFDVLGEGEIAPSMNEANNCISDFYWIRSESGIIPFHPSHAVEKYKESKSWLDQELERCDPDKTVVITHFPPCREARHGKIKEDLLANYFQANCMDLIQKHSPRYWIYGHNHWSDELQIGRTIVCSNQLGYLQEDGTLPKYSPNKIITI